MRPGDKLSETAPRGAGRLIVRVSGAGTREFYFRSRSGGRDRTIKLGNYPELTLADARRQATKAGSGSAAIEARGTFGDLLTAYVAHLEARGKVSAAGVRCSLVKAIPETAAIRRKRAAAITAADLTDIIGQRLRDGVTTEANRVRSYLSAAFAHGARLDYDPRRTGARSARFGLSGNPATVVARIAEFEIPRDRVLTWDELGAYWLALEPESPIIKATLRFILAIGGQRVQQVLRAGWDDVRDDAIEITDSKGRGGARRHVVPIPPLAAQELDTLRAYPVPFMVTHYTLGGAIGRARARMGDVEPFDARDLRRSVETRLADLGVSRETLAHLLSHGRSGVQAKHYDRAERLDEKRAALDLWSKHLQAAIEKRRDQPARPAGGRKSGRTATARTAISGASTE